MTKMEALGERLDLLEAGYASRFLMLASRITALEKRLDAYGKGNGVAATDPFDGDLLCADPELVNIDAELANAEH